jgi:hypothetical protein
MLGLLQLLWLMSSDQALPGWCIINQCWREPRGAEVDSFPLAIVSINFTCIAFDAFARGKLAAQIEGAQISGNDRSVFQVYTFFELPPLLANKASLFSARLLIHCEPSHIISFVFDPLLFFRRV